MKFLKFTVILLAGIALVFTFPLLAGKHGSGACDKACGIPDLTPEQTAKIQKLKIEHQKALLALQTDLKTGQLDLRQMMMEGADQKKLEAKIDELAKVRANIQKKCLTNHKAIRSLLTDEQKKFFDQKCAGMSCSAGLGHGRCGGADCRDHKMGRKGHQGCGK